MSIRPVIAAVLLSSFPLIHSGTQSEADPPFRLVVEKNPSKAEELLNAAGARGYKVVASNHVPAEGLKLVTSRYGYLCFVLQRQEGTAHNYKIVTHDWSRIFQELDKAGSAGYR